MSLAGLRAGRLVVGLVALATLACTQARGLAVAPGTSAVSVTAFSPSPSPAPAEPAIAPASPVPTAPPAGAVSPLPVAAPGLSLPAGAPGALAPAPAVTPIPPSPLPAPSPSATATPLVGVPATVVGRLGATPETGRLARLLAVAGLEATLGAAGPYTVFAPTDIAFARLAMGDLAALERPENRPQLQSILRHHVVAGSLGRSALVDARLTSLAGLTLPVTTVGGAPRVGGAGVVTADLTAGNGVVHTIDAVLMPPELTPVATTVVDVVAAHPDLPVLEQALAASDLLTQLRGTGPFTLFAPTDAGFDQTLPEGAVARLLQPQNQAALDALLRYHVVRGRAYRSGELLPGSLPSLYPGPQNGILLTVGVDGPRVGNHRVRQLDTFAFNGVVHVIDGVLLPPGFVLP